MVEQGYTNKQIEICLVAGKSAQCPRWKSPNTSEMAKVRTQINESITEEQRKSTA